MGLGHHHVGVGQTVKAGGIVVERHRQHHAVGGHALGGEHHTGSDSVLHHAGTLGVDNILAGDIEVQRGRSALQLRACRHHGADLVQTGAPCVKVDLLLFSCQRLLVILFHGSLGETGCCVLIGHIGRYFRLRLTIDVHGKIVTAAHLTPDAGPQAIDVAVVHGQHPWSHVASLAVGSTLGGQFEIVEPWVSHSDLRRQRPALLRVLGHCHTHVALDVHPSEVVHSQRHEIRFHRLLSQLLVLTVQLSLKRLKQDVTILCTDIQTADSK